MRHADHRLPCLVAAALSVAVAATGCGSGDDRNGRAATPPVVRTYVGSQACAECHPGQLADWEGSHHDRAMQTAEPSTVLGDFADATFAWHGVTSTFSRRDEKFFVRTDGPDGRLREYEIAYTFGVDPLQQYLVRFPGGRLQALGIAWDTRPARAGGQRWFHLYPNEAMTHRHPLHWTGRNQTWNYMCAECHSTNLRKNYRPADDAYDTTWGEIDVSCEACHGPGSRHVELARAPGASPDTLGRDPGLALRFERATTWSIAPGTVTATRSRPYRSAIEIETCGRCHARRSVIDETYVHGRPLMDTHRPALLAEGLYHPDGQILEEVYEYGSFLQSRMHANGVSCSDCHDPHSLRLRTAGNALCGTCHLPAHFDAPAHHFHEPGSPGARCVACHMPERTYMVVDVRHDHGFRIPRPDLSVDLGTPNPCTGCHADRSAAWAAAAVRKRHGTGRAREPHFARALHAAWRHLPGADAALTVLATDRERPGIVRATALGLLGDRLGPASLPTVEQALADGDPLVRMAACGALSSLDARTRRNLIARLLGDPIRSIRLEAAVALADVPPGAWSAEDRRSLERALGEYRQAQLANGERPEAHVNLGLLEARQGNAEQARAAYDRAIAIDPLFVPAYVNLVDLDRMQGRDDEGERVLRRALAVAPQNADLHHALGLLLARTRREAECLAELGRAAELDRSEPRHAYAYGVALHSAGKTARALAILGAAHERFPGHRDILVALATISRDAGARAEGLRYATLLLALSPGDPMAAALVDELRGSP
jgi:tetratricopeptide (TPR) repeat protein